MNFVNVYFREANKNKLKLKPVHKLLQYSKGYRMGAPGNRNVNRTHCLSADDFKQHQESHKILKDVNKVIV